MDTDIIFLVVGIFYLVSFIALFRYYRVLKTSEYLMASFIFLALFINGVMINFFGGLGTTIEIIPVLIAIFLLLFVTKHTLSRRYVKFFYTVFIMIVLLSILEIILTTLSKPVFDLVQIVNFELIRFMVGFYLFYSYKNIKVIIESSRTQIVRFAWMTSGTIQMLTSLYRMIDVIVYMYQTSETNWSGIAGELEISLLLVSLGALILSVITGIIAIFYPEVFILSKQQVERLDELYELSDIIEAQNDKPFSIFPNSFLLEYLESIADELKKLDDDSSTV